MKKVLLPMMMLVVHTHLILAQNFWKTAIKGEGPIVKKELNLSHFEGIRSGFSCDVYITQGDQQKVEVEGQQNILDNLVMDVSGEILKIKYDRMVKRAEPVKVYITMDNLVEASVSGSGSLVSTSKFTGLGDLEVSVSGSGDLKLEVDAEDIDMSVSGSGDIELGGSAQDLVMSISGSGGIDSRDLMARDCRVSVSGSGNATVYVKNALDAKISGSGNVRYKGDVAKISSRVSGSGHISSL